MLAIHAVTEGYPDEIVVHALCRTAGLSATRIYNCRGKANLDAKIAGYNQAVMGWYWLVLRDLNHDADCGPELRERLLPLPAPYMQFRIVVHEVEAWLLGDRERMGRFLGVAASRISGNPERLDNPKAEVIRLAGMSRRRDIREDMVPRPGSGAREGPAYARRLAEYAENSWRPDTASLICDSLRRCLRRLREWAELPADEWPK